MQAARKLESQQEVEPKLPGPTLFDQRRLGIWFLWLALAIAFLVAVGGSVRITGSGLSIPDWPLIDGSLLPPTSDEGWERVYRTYYSEIHNLDVTGPKDARFTDLLSLGRFQILFAIEYFHRFIAALVGILFFALFVQSMRRSLVRKRMGGRLVGMGFLLLLQAILGGIVVKLDLRAEFVAAHLGLAFLFFALVLWTALQLLFPPPEVVSKRVTTPLYALGWLTLAAVYLQILGGGMVAGTHAGYIYNMWPNMGDGLIPAASLLWSTEFQPAFLNILKNQILLQFLHRWWGVFAAVLVFALLFLSLKTTTSPRARIGMRALGSIVVLQLFLGIMTLVTKVQPLIAITHLMVGLLLFATLVFINFEFKHHEATHI